MFDAGEQIDNGTIEFRIMYYIADKKCNSTFYFAAGDHIS